MGSLTASACPPLLIHSDKGKSKAKEKDKRNTQRNGEMPWNDDVSPWFLEGLDEKLGVNTLRFNDARGVLVQQDCRALHCSTTQQS
jgi:hypothetical protein